ncbi:dTDP-4-dehydrorhamnose 3,5-epimerase family protein [Segatella copri]|uniref:dTDP-4-dehydrorhamnose 3,5-epimerase family protein n=1 Tax=Segatella copri TaxID=165179 RepID=UPI00346100C3
MALCEACTSCAHLYTQSKLVCCVKGRVLDVAVDIRKGSPYLWQACGCRADRRQSCPVLHPKRLCPWFRSPLRNRSLPVQV